MYSKCLRCNRGLSDPESIRLGYGPVCMKKARGEEKAKGKADQELDFVANGELAYKDNPPEQITVRRNASGSLITNVPHAWAYHSPTGFEIGYGGSGPADFALNILLMYIDRPNAWLYHQEFKRDFIASMNQDGGVIKKEDILKWIEQQK